MNIFPKLPILLTCIGFQGCLFCSYSILQYRYESLEMIEQIGFSSKIQLPSQLFLFGHISSLFLFVGLLYLLEDLSVLKNKSRGNVLEKSSEETICKNILTNNTKAKHLKHFLQTRIPKCPY